MGFKALGKTNVLKKDVNWMDEVRKCKGRVPFDVANLLFTVAWHHAASCYHGDYKLAIASLKKYFKFYQREGLNLLYILDGKLNQFKGAEHIRRGKGRALAETIINDKIEEGSRASIETYRKCVKNTPRYIALVAKLLRSMKLPFIVAPGEADGQLAHHASTHDGVVVSFDSDLFAYGVLDKLHVQPGGWHSGRAKLYSVRSFVSNSTARAEGADDDILNGRDSDNQLATISSLYRKHGAEGLVYFGALTGCDYSPLSSGIPGVGVKLACKVLTSASKLSSQALAKTIHDDYIEKLYGSFKKYALEGGVHFIQEHIEVVVQAFACSEYYDDERAVRLVGAGHIISSTEDYSSNKRHALGELDPSTGSDFSAEDKCCIDNFDIELIGKSALHIDKEYVSQCRIPDNYESFKVDQLRAIVAARGGTVTHNKPELLQYVKAMKEMEEEYDPIVIDPSSGFFLPTLSTKSNMNPRDEIEKLLLETEVQRNREWKDLLSLAKKEYDKGKILEDMDEIGMSAAVMDKKFLQLIYTDVGTVRQSSNRKAIRDSVMKSKEQISNADVAKRYHGYAVISDAQHLLITTQSSSLGKDESTRSKKNAGEKPDPKLYLNVMLLAVVPTNEEEDGHAFGVVDNVISMWCGCKAGQKECIHCGMACLDQIRVWAPNYSGDDICTNKEKQWQHRGAGKLRSYNALLPIHCHGFEKIVDHRTDFKYRTAREARSVNDSLHYSVLSHEDFELLDSKVKPSTLFPLYDMLQRKRKDKRPCRAALVYQDGVTDDGLQDVRQDVHLWGTRSEIEEHKRRRLEDDDGAGDPQLEASASTK